MNKTDKELAELYANNWYGAILDLLQKPENKSDESQKLIVKAHLKEAFLCGYEAGFPDGYKAGYKDK